VAPSLSTSTRFQFERTSDYKIIGDLIRNPKLWPYLTDDFSPAMEDFQPTESPAIWYVLVRDGDELLGLFALVPQSTIVFEFHTVMPLNGRALKAFDELLGPGGWLWANTPCVRAVTFVAESNAIAHRFGIRAGLKAYGRNPLSYQKNGTLQDQILFGISKPKDQ